MMTLQRLRALSSALVLGISLSLASSGCERDNPAPPDAGRRDAGPRDAGDGDLDAGPDPIDAGPPVDAGPVDSSIPDSGCVPDPTCWSCPKTQPEHFLNGCTDATCRPFPINTTRLPRLRADGTVPPLP